MNARAGRRVMVIAADTPFKSAVMAALRDAPGIVDVVGTGAAHSQLSSRRAARDLLFGPAAQGVDTIIYAPPRLSADDGPWDRDVEATRELLDAAEEAPEIGSFILCSSSAVYRLARDQPRLISENEPLDFASPFARVRRLIACDVTACTRIASERLRIAVLRDAEILAPGCDSQLHDYLRSRVCFLPLGYDPMINVLSLADAANAVTLATASSAAGVFNVPGRDILPLSELIHRTGRIGLPVPGPLIAPLYRMRTVVTAGRFRYDLDELRFHYGALLDGRKAHDILGYVPGHAVGLTTLF